MAVANERERGESEAEAEGGKRKTERRTVRRKRDTGEYEAAESNSGASGTGVKSGEKGVFGSIICIV